MSIDVYMNIYMSFIHSQSNINVHVPYIASTESNDHIHSPTGDFYGPAVDNHSSVNNNSLRKGKDMYPLTKVFLHFMKKIMTIPILCQMYMKESS